MDKQNQIINKGYRTKLKNLKKFHNEFDIDYDTTNKKDKNNDDDRMIYILITLGLGKLVNIFNEKNISFTDLLLLSKESLKDLGLEMYQRNRIYNFTTLFNRNAKDYSIREITEFFNTHQQFLFSPTIYNKMIINNEREKNNDNQFFSDDENKNYKKIKNSINNVHSPLKSNKNNNFSSGKNVFKASKMFKKFLLIKKGVDEFLNKINKQKEDTKNMSYKYNALIKKINSLNDNYNDIFDKNEQRKIFNYNKNYENEELLNDFEVKNSKINLNVEKNKNDEYNELIEKVNKLEQVKIDDNSSEHINQIKKYINEKGLYLKTDEISSLKNELEKITEIINKKQQLKKNLEKYNKKIEERKKMINKLENEYNGINNFEKKEDK